jgi:nucleobase:cation symporter-1, NCS1 family
VSKRSNIVGPSVIGVGVLGAAFVSTVAALAAISAGTYDPIVWMIAVGGPVFGSIVMSIVLTANLGTMVLNVYLAGVSIQQVNLFARMPWRLLLAVLLAPGIYFAFKTEWLLSVVMNWLSYNGVMFVGITAVTLTDYFVLRKERLDPVSLFAARDGKYRFWGGVNWLAVIVTIGSAVAYLWLYDPVSYAMSEPFRYFGASIPVVVASALVYYLGARLFLIPGDRGSYARSAAGISRPTLDEAPKAGWVSVRL